MFWNKKKTGLVELEKIEMRIEYKEDPDWFVKLTKLYDEAKDLVHKNGYVNNYSKLQLWLHIEKKLPEDYNSYGDANMELATTDVKITWKKPVKE